MKYTAAKIAQILYLPVPANEPDREITSLLTDSRALGAGEGSLFFALATKTGDGHNYIADLYGRGVRDFVVRKVPAEVAKLPGCNFFVTPSPLKALQQIAASHRRKMPARVIGITGSRGKTIVKEWICQALGSTRGVVRSPRSFNSQIGVPLSLWQIKEDSHTALIEAGISGVGEMQVLADMIDPDIAVITNLGDAHADGFPSKRVKAMEKAILASKAGTVVYPADDSLIKETLGLIASDKLHLGWSRTDADAAIYINSEQPEGEGTAIAYRFRGRDESAWLPFTQPHDIENALTTLATLLALGIEPGRISYALRSLRRIGTRIDVSDGVNGCLLAFDSFTCDADSLQTALDFMQRRLKAAADDHRAPVVILSDLYHDPHADIAALCRHIASLLRAAGVRRFIGVGPELSANASLFGDDALFFPDTDSLMSHLSTSDFNREFILLKGAPDYDFRRILRNLESRTHETVLEVNLDAIVKNFNYFRSKLPSSTGIVAMVKASGYGAGSLEIAKTMQSQGAAYLAVAVLDEGIELRRAGITMPIMVMNPKVLNYRAMFNHRLEPEIYSFEMLYDVMREAAKCGIKDYPIHIKLDTGMHRTGFNEDELPGLIGTLKSADTVKAATLFSHLATSDCPDMDDYTLLQLDRFARYTEQIMGGLPYPVKRHVLNSAGILRFPEHHYDYARLGIGLYGANTLPEDMEKPLAVVSTLRTVIISLKERKAGETIGYGRRGVLTRDSMIATIPIGYADGMNRHFGCGAVKVCVNGQEAPTVGNICMDACMIDVTGIPCKTGDSVEIFGENMPVQRLADLLDTIPYEILTSVSPRVKRIYFRE